MDNKYTKRNKYVIIDEEYSYSFDVVDNKYVVMDEHSYCSDIKLKRYGNQKNKLYIGKFCSISKSLEVFLGGNHRTDWITTFPFNVLWDAKHIKGHPYSNGDVNIKNDVWIGENVTIMSGITIGNGAVIATGSCVTKDVEDYCIYGGNPAKFIKKRFTDDQIHQLLNIEWWNFDDDKIKSLIPYLLSTDINKFIEMGK